MQTRTKDKSLNVHPAYISGPRKALATGILAALCITILFLIADHASVSKYLRQSRRHAARVAQTLAQAVARDPAHFLHAAETVPRTTLWHNINALRKAGQNPLSVSLYIVNPRANGEGRCFASIGPSPSSALFCPLAQTGPGATKALEAEPAMAALSHPAAQRLLLLVPVKDAEDTVIGAVGVSMPVEKALYRIHRQTFLHLAVTLTGICAWALLAAHWCMRRAAGTLHEPAAAPAPSAKTLRAAKDAPGRAPQRLFHMGIPPICRSKKSASPYTVAPLNRMGGYLRVERKSGYEPGALIYEMVSGEAVSSMSASPPPVKARSRRSARPRTVLICEDNFISQIVLMEHLRKLGLTVEAAEDGLQGVQLVQERLAAGKPYDLILMDMQMPVMDGMEAALVLQRMGNATPILAMSGGILEAEQEKCRQYGIAGFLFKPFRMQELHSCLSAYLPIASNAAQEVQRITQSGEGAVSNVLDYESGLASAMNKPDFYTRQLATFYQGNLSCSETLCQAFDSGDTVQACRIAHSLRSTAGLIGAHRLQATAQTLELSLHEGISDPSQLVQDLCAELNLVLEAIQPHLPKAPDIQESSDAQQAFADELDAQLRAKRASAVSYVEKIPIVFNESGDLGAKLIQHILAYDFDEAREALAQIRSTTPCPGQTRG